MKAMLVLEDGTVFEGLSFGAEGERIGRVIINTAVVEYQEMMTDPANAGKILVLTYPLIGNYGVAKKFNESEKCWLAGLVIKEPSRIYSNWQAEGSLDDFVQKEGLVTIADIDTRTIAVTLRDKGEIFGIISTGSAEKDDLLKKVREYKKTASVDFIKKISVKKPLEIKGSGPKIAVLDIGITNSLIDQLKTLGCNITILPYDTDASSILAKRYNGLIISNGPENDEALATVTQTVRALISKLPILGIATGHHVIALALGGRLKKLPMGHRGVNYPVRPPKSFKGAITVQNHGYAVDEASLKAHKDIFMTLKNINDNTIEEMECKALKFISAQYYPASPGFGEVNELLTRFLKMKPVKKGRQCRDGGRSNPKECEVVNAEA